MENKKVGRTDRLKTKERFTSTIDKELKKELDELSNKTLINKSRLLEVALRKLMQEYKENGSITLD